MSLQVFIYASFRDLQVAKNGLVKMYEVYGVLMGARQSTSYMTRQHLFGEESEAAGIIEEDGSSAGLEEAKSRVSCLNCEIESIRINFTLVDDHLDANIPLLRFQLQIVAETAHASSQSGKGVTETGSSVDSVSACHTRHNFQFLISNF